MEVQRKGHYAVFTLSLIMLPQYKYENGACITVCNKKWVPILFLQEICLSMHAGAILLWNEFWQIMFYCYYFNILDMSVWLNLAVKINFCILDATKLYTSVLNLVFSGPQIEKSFLSLRESSFNWKEILLYKYVIKKHLNYMFIWVPF